MYESKLAERTGNKDAEFLAVAVGVQKIGGGNLAELLESTAERIESKQELQGDIDAITSQGRYASKFIAVFPFLVLGAVVLGAPDRGAAFWASAWWPLVLAALAVCYRLGHEECERSSRPPLVAQRNLVSSPAVFFLSTFSNKPLLVFGKALVANWSKFLSLVRNKTTEAGDTL